MVAPSDVGRIWERHILDSLRALRCLSPTDRTLADLGSGAGLPGIPVAIARPKSVVVLVEPKRRRAAFLELAAERLELGNVRVQPTRAAEADLEADLVMARALADPAAAWAMAQPLLRPGGRVLYFAGRTWDAGQAAIVSEAGARVSVCVEPVVAWEGPLVMMSPAVPSSSKAND